jgi:hypothetical protein
MLYTMQLGQALAKVLAVAVDPRDVWLDANLRKERGHIIHATNNKY